MTKARATPYAFPAFFRHPGRPVPDAISSPIFHALDRLAAGRSLTGDEAGAAFDVVMRGEATAAQIGSLLLGLRAKGESADEVAGAARALRRAMSVVALPDVDFRVVCSKGFYVRTYCHDIGAKLGCGGHMAGLRRTRSGKFTVEGNPPSTN